MATKKTRKKPTKRKRTALTKPLKKTARNKSSKKAAPRKTLAARKPATNKRAVKPKASATKKAGAKTAAGASRKRIQGKGQSANFGPFGNETVKARSAGQSGSLQGLSDAAGADSESVDELIEEGNAFEGGVVSGVEAADRADEQEVHTHEVPEDDVPGEYLDQD